MSLPSDLNTIFTYAFLSHIPTPVIETFCDNPLVQKHIVGNKCQCLVKFRNAYKKFNNEQNTNLKQETELTTIVKKCKTPLQIFGIILLILLGFLLLASIIYAIVKSFSGKKTTRVENLTVVKKAKIQEV